MNEIEDTIIEDDDLIYQLLQIIAFRWIIGTNESNSKTIIVENILEDDNEELEFNYIKIIINNKIKLFK